MMHSPKDRMAMMMAGEPMPPEMGMQGAGMPPEQPMQGGGQGMPQLQPEQIAELIAILQANGVQIGGGGEAPAGPAMVG